LVLFSIDRLVYFFSYTGTKIHMHLVWNKKKYRRNGEKGGEISKFWNRALFGNEEIENKAIGQKNEKINVTGKT